VALCGVLASKASQGSKREWNERFGGEHSGGVRPRETNEVSLPMRGGTVEYGSFEGDTLPDKQTVVFR
jgi:hypothetical protein